MGTYVGEFEQRFADYVGSRFCVMVKSGSSASLLMVASLFFRKEGELRHGDEVIVPAVSWSTTYSPLSQYGLKLKFVGIDINTLNFDLEQLEAAISSNTRMIVAVSLLGNPNDFTRTKEVMGDRDIILIEDSCESVGVEYQWGMAQIILIPLPIYLVIKFYCFILQVILGCIREIHLFFGLKFRIMIRQGQS